MKYLNMTSEIFGSVRGLSGSNEDIEAMHTSLSKSTVLEGVQKIICTNIFSVTEFGEELLAHLAVSPKEKRIYKMQNGTIITTEESNSDIQELVEKGRIAKAIKDAGEKHDIAGAILLFKIETLRTNGKHRFAGYVAMRDKDMPYNQWFVSVAKRCKSLDELLLEINVNLRDTTKYSVEEYKS